MRIKAAGTLWRLKSSLTDYQRQGISSDKYFDRLIQRDGPLSAFIPVVEALGVTLHDPEASVRRAAAEALYRIGLEGPQAVEPSNWL